MYSVSTSLALTDCGQSITTNNNSAGITLTVADTITNVGPASSCVYTIYTQGSYPVTVAATSAATFNGSAGPITLAQNTPYVIETTGIPGSALNWSVSPAPPIGNTPATMTSSTGNTIGQLNIARGAVITRSNCAAALTDTTATAAQIVAQMPANTVVINNGPPKFRIKNTCGAGDTETIAGGTGVTPVGTITIAPGTWLDILLTLTTAAPTPAFSMSDAGGGTIN
jgi:hypothetical protein